MAVYPPDNIMVARQLLPVTQKTPLIMSLTGGRVHELAIQNWCYDSFLVQTGYPIPVVFATPMDAFSTFQVLWGSPDNPFAYLLGAKDAEGKPLYEPYPANVRYPVISVKRGGWKYRVNQSYGIHRNRGPYFASVGSIPNGAASDLRAVTVTHRYPTAWDYRFQLDHFCSRPDTQALFVESVFRLFKYSGGIPETWIPVAYPGWFGNSEIPQNYARLYLEGDIQNITPDEPTDGSPVEFRTSLSVVLEGYAADFDYELNPALWTQITGYNPVSPDDLKKYFNPPIISETDDLRK